MTTVQATPTSSRLKGMLRGISRRWQRLIKPHPSIQDPGTRRQVQLQAAFILVMISLFAVSALFTWQVGVQNLRPESVAQLVSVGVLLAAYWLSRTRRYESGVILVVASLSLTAFAIVFANPTSANTIFYAFIPLTFVIGGFLLRTSYAAVLVAVDTLLIFSMPLLKPGQIDFGDIAAEGGVTLTLGILLIVFSVVRNLTERDRLEVLNQANVELRDLRNSLEERVAQRTGQLRASAAVGQAAISVLDRDSLMRQVVSLIAERFGFYYAAVFTLDDTGRYAVLREGTGEAGRVLKEQGHKLEVGGQSMVGFVTAQHTARIALDVGTEAVRFANPLLPDTRSEIALPLIVGNRIWGALDVQSTQPAAFDEANAVVLQSMADQIAVALNNAEQFKQTEELAKQQSNLNQFSRSLFAASTAEELYRAIAATPHGIVVHDYVSLTLTQPGSASLREYPLQAEADPVLVEGPVWSMTNTMSGQASATRHPVISTRLAQDVALNDAAHLAQAGFESALCLPLIVGERVLGTLNFASRELGSYSLASLSQLELLAGQVAIALENQRLAQTQQVNLREMEALTRQLTGQAWAKRQQRQAAESAQYVRSGIETKLPATTPEIEAAMEQRAPIARSMSDNPASPYQSTLAVPVVLRGEVLGGLQVGEARQAREWTEDDLTFMQAVADQVALALDNARLIEETKRRAERERVVADISSRMFAANDLETIVQIAGEELGRILQVNRTEVTVSQKFIEPASKTTLLEGN